MTRGTVATRAAGGGAVKRRGGAGVLDQFSRYQRGCGFSEATVRRRRGTLEALTRFLAPTELADATTMDLEEWLFSKRSARTRHAYRSDLRSFYAWAVKRRLLANNPAEGLDSIRLPKALPRPLGPEAVTLLQHGSRKTRQMVALGLYAGMRCGEIAALCAEDVWMHAELPVIIIRNGKGGKDRQVPMSAELHELLVGCPSAGPLFPGRFGSVRAASVSQRIRRHLAAAGITATPHQLRHTFGTAVARKSNGNVLLTGHLMGHASPTTTMGYIQLSDTQGRDVVEGLYGGAA